MTSDDKIEALIHTAPVVPLSRRDRIERVFGWVTGVIAVAGLTVAVLVGLNGSQIAGCINTDLGKRSAPSQKDAAAHITYAQALSVSQHAQNATSSALFTLLSAPKPQQAADYAAFLATFAKGQIVAAATEHATDQYKATLAADQKMRDDSPLGKC